MLRTPHLGLIAACLLLCTLPAGCASTPDVGVRDDYRSARVRSVAVVPFYASGTFGMPTAHFEPLRMAYQAQAMAWLEDMGFEVIAPDALENHLRERELWEIFDEGVALHGSLHRYFEPVDDQTEPRVEVLTLRTINEQDALPADTLLVGQIVYHSRGICRQSPSSFTRYARTSSTADAPTEFPRPCVISHFQAKLIDTRTGHTMWFNRMYREFYSRQLNEDITQRNIARTIADTLGDGSGLTELLADDTAPTSEASAVRPD
ncbi:hypothetical protein DV096_03625 [Bradymonadaceae bacterium TMQ3]|uniref:DUF4136 domain-containing protein n=1 Tax=Lujinxingia sediminis TaxID=2480984 RepID=A0ABY0CXE8_9DELT|nr:hypothetical protein [Lujinxingia sediminis]RDV39666.1 hypothetical protein DV096_03625 [Bradymonadaceae bacterium TMQ3]RVU48289.1 hypothetical protein EA187_02305 [Lujinxingia sediminis]TXC77589.1 hypothetical protein FRC91_02310 [Bradymonadales bacterium TMQ1]